MAEYPSADHPALRSVLSIGDAWNPDRTIVLTSSTDTIEKHIRQRNRDHEEVENMVRRFRLIDSEFRRLAPQYPNTVVIDRDSNVDFSAARAQLRFIASDDLEFNLSADWTSDHRNPTGMVLLDYKPQSAAILANIQPFYDANPLNDVSGTPFVTGKGSYRTYATFSNAAGLYNGTTTVIGGGSLINGNDNVLPAGTDLILGKSGETSSTTNSYNLSGKSQTVASLASAGSGVNVITNSTGSANLTMSSAVNKTLSNLKIGGNNFTLTKATAVAAPLFSSGVGSSYSASFSIANGLGTGTTGYGGTVTQANAYSTAAVTCARAIRIANTVQYSSPAMNGFSAHIGITPQNNNNTGSGSATGVNNNVGMKECALRYTNGPVDAMSTSIKYEVRSLGVSQARFTAATTSTAGTTTATSAVGNTLISGSTTSTQNLLGASYAVNSALKLHAGLG